jgi:drug/metabolite transporter (DMT)-like permease
MLTKIVMVVLWLIGILALLDGAAGFLFARFVPQEQSGLLLMLFGAVCLGFGATIGAVRRVEQAAAKSATGNQ